MEIRHHASSDGLIEVVSISTEMQITPAERREPGDRDLAIPLKRPRRGRERHEEMQVIPADRSEPEVSIPATPEKNSKRPDISSEM